MSNKTDHNNKRLVLSVFFVVLCMTGLSFAAVPLYNMFCSVTGYGGTTQVSQELPDEVLERIITISFNADTARDMPWKFKPEARKIDIHIGQKGFINFLASNPASTPISGTAIYNVVPSKAGQYFHKIQCFCFDKQTLAPGQQANMPVIFYVDPSINDDRNLDDVNNITLSYTFFQAESDTLDQALEEFYNDPAK